LKISDIRIRLLGKDENKMKAVASITIEDCFVVHDIRIIEGTKGNFIAMPSRKTANGEYKDIAHPIDTTTRNSIEAQILEAFDRAVAAEGIV
jgi:stage V sporulation protein G